MPNDVRAAYVSRFERVLAHVETHLDDPLTVEALARVAAFSPHHFHRQFAELFGINVHRYVTLVRLRRAAYELAFRPARRILDIALDSGYESHEAFARAFKRTVGQPPSDFRQAPDWKPWHAAYEHLRATRSLHMQPKHTAADVAIVDFPTTHLAVVEHRGDPDLLEATAGRFIAWRRKHRLPPRTHATFNLVYDDPTATPAADFRFDFGVATTIARGATDVDVDGVVAKTIPAGRCAKLRHVGSDDTLGASLRYLYATWLPTSGEEPRDYPLFLQRVSFFPDVAEHEAIVDIFLPLR